MRLVSLSGALIVLAALIAPLEATDPPKVPDWTGRDPAAERSPGAQLYRDNCAACHDAGINRAPQRLLLGDMTPEAINRALTTGAMKPQGAALSPAQRLAVSEYLAGRPIGAARGEAAGNLCKGAAARFDMGEPPPFAGWGLDPASTHAIPAAVSGLDPATAPRLRLKWAFGFPNSSRARSHPTLAGGAVLVGNHNGRVYALDRETGCIRWAFAAEAEVRTGIVVTPWRAGDARARPLVHFGDITGRVYALDLRTGRQVWKIRADAHPAAIITGTPSLHRGTLYVPVSSNEEAFATSPAYPCCSFRGSVVALDARTGREKWRTWLVGEPSVQGLSPDGPERLGPSGVAVWNSPAIDEKRGQLYVATGDNYSQPATELSDAVIALDLATGRIRWQHQVLGGDAWNVACVTRTSASCPEDEGPDFDFGAGAVLAKGADGRELVLAGQKSGWVYAFDPAGGALAWKQRLGRGSASGGVHFGMAADAGRLFVPMSDRFVSGPDTFPPRPGLFALDVATGRTLWEAPDTGNRCTADPRCLAGYGGAVTATAGLVLIGADDGHLRVYDAASGKVLWQDQTARAFQTVNGVAARGGSISGGVAPIAYRGKLIVASGYGYASKTPGNVLLVYGVE
jgi:polyvinyl alcohol dehydrogenase (cytochrome)